MERKAEIGVGIDIGKHKHTAILRDGEGRDLCPEFQGRACSSA